MTTREKAASIRARAEEKVRKDGLLLLDGAPISPEEASRTLHELRVHQVELEIQNESLRHAQHALELAHARYFDLYDLAPVGYCTLNAGGTIVEANLTVATLLGVPRGALVNQPFNRFIQPEHQDTFYLRHKALLDLRQPQSCELRMRRADGGGFWALLDASVVEDAAGGVGCRVTVTDVNARKTLDVERELTAHLAGLDSHAGDFRGHMHELAGLLRTWSGLEAVGIHLRAGDDFPYFGVDGFPARHMEDEERLCSLDGEGKVVLEPDGTPALHCMCGRVTGGKTGPGGKAFFTAQGTFWTNQLSNLDDADAGMPPQGWMCRQQGYQSMALVPLRAGGAVLGILQFNDHRPHQLVPGLVEALERVAQNLAEALARRHAELSLRDSEARYRGLFENMAEAYALCRVNCENGVATDFTYLAVNAAFGRLTGLHDVVGKPVSQVIPTLRQADPELFAAFVRVAATGKPEKMEMLVAALNMWCAIALYCPEPGCFVAVFDVITERKKAAAEKEALQTQLMQAQKMEAIGTLAGGVAHDFNNILAAIQGGLSLLDMDLGELHSGHKDVRDMSAMVQRGADLTRQLLGFGRRGKFDVKPLNLLRVVEKTSSLFGRTRKDITLKVEDAGNVPTVLMDHTQLEQVLLNLLVNAGHAMPQGGTVVLSASGVDLGPQDVGADGVKPGHFARLVVRDTGVGMDAATLPRIFEPFFTTRPAGKGTGLGLASVYGIIKGHGGIIRVESEPGKGAAFTLFLPSTLQVPAEEGATLSAVPRGKGTILVVDDEPQLAMLCARLLKTVGYEVYTATGGQQALEILKVHGKEISLVMLDMVMPEMSGRQTFDAIRAMVPDMKVLLSSGYTLDGQAQEIIALGCNGFIQKPYALAALTQKIREIL